MSVSLHPSYYHSSITRLSPVPESDESSLPSSPERSLRTPVSFEQDFVFPIHFFIPPDIPHNLAIHIRNIQSQLAATPPESLLPKHPDLHIPPAEITSDDSYHVTSTLDPTSSHLPAASRPYTYTLLKSASTSRPCFYASFIEGIRTTNPSEASAHALNLIKPTVWNDGMFTQLVQWICWTAAVPQTTETAMLASFISLLYDKFGKYSGRDVGRAFGSHLTEAVGFLFESCWSHASPDAISHSYTPSETYISSAIRLVSFMGQLHAHSMIHPYIIHHSLGVLIDEMVAIEHIQAIHALIQNSGKELWSRLPTDTITIFDFVHAFSTRTQKIREGTRSISGQYRSATEIYKAAAEVLELVNVWKDEMDAEQTEHSPL